jgi:hypothetical protein
MRTNSARRSTGTSLAELPVNLWIFIFLLLIPFIDFVTMGCRGSLAYFGVRDATLQASLQNNFSTAMSTANAVLAKDAGAWTGIGYSSTNVYAVQVDQSGVETQGPANAPWPAAIAAQDVYLIRVATQASCDPLVNMAPSGSWGSVPGLTSPITITFTYQVAFESPQGLVK